MTDLLFTQPSASKEELQNACSFIQSECKCNRRPYDMFPVVCGGLRPLYSGSTTEAELLASINTLLSPPSPHDGTWSRLPSARYVPTAQQALFKCGGLDPLVTSLGFPSAVNRPAISRLKPPTTLHVAFSFSIQVHCPCCRTAAHPRCSCRGIGRVVLSG
jgi:hypothetical protein